MMGDMLPAHGTMSPEQLEGFRVACVCMITWGRQIEGNAISLAGDPVPMQPVRLMEERARFLQDCARALYITLGHGQMPAAPPSLLPPRG